MERQMNRYFRDFPSTSSTPTEQGQVTQPELTTFWPRTDLRELDNEYQVLLTKLAVITLEDSYGAAWREEGRREH